MACADALSLGLLQGVITPWLHHLHLEGLSGVEDDWMPVLAGARHCASLNISGAAVRAVSCVSHNALLSVGVRVWRQELN